METTTPNQPERPTLAAQMLVHYTSDYTDKAAKLVSRVREMADRLERELRPGDKASGVGTPRYSHAVQQALEGLAWDMANAQTPDLVGAAARADAAEAAVAVEQTATRPVPHDCTSCGTSIEDCDQAIVDTGRSCCGECYRTDTHGDTPSTYADRVAARKAAES